MAVADELARLIALRDAGHLTDEEFQGAKDAVLGQTRILESMTPEPPTAGIHDPSGDETPQTLATASEPTRQSRRPLLVALAVLIVLLAGGVAYVLSGSSRHQVTRGHSSPTSSPTASPASTFASPTTASPASPLPSLTTASPASPLPSLTAASPASPLPSLTTAASTSPAPVPPTVTSKALLAALHGRPLVADPDIPAAVISASSDYTPPGDSVPSARLLGGVSFTIAGNQTSGVDANILIFEGPQDAAAQNQQELDTAQAGGTPYSTLTVDKNIVSCSPKGSVCLATVGRAAIRSASYSDADNKYVVASIRAAMRTVAAARAAVVAQRTP